jgi:hypothetical protein
MEDCDVLQAFDIETIKKKETEKINMELFSHENENYDTYEKDDITELFETDPYETKDILDLNEIIKPITVDYENTHTNSKKETKTIVNELFSKISQDLIVSFIKLIIVYMLFQTESVIQFFEENLPVGFNNSKHFYAYYGIRAVLFAVAYKLVVKYL